MKPIQEARGPSRNEAPHLCVVVPLYRAEAHILRVLEGIPAFVRSVVVVDDCSPDGSWTRVRLHSDPRVQLLRHDRNQGVGGAMLSGYRRARELGAEVVVKMDADGQMDPAWLLHLIRPILAGEADYTKGNRFLHARELKGMPFPRRIGNLALSFLAKLASGYWGVFDPTNGYTAIHAAILPLLNERAIDRRFFFETSMLVELGLVGAVVKDVHIPARYGDETSNLSERSALLRFPPRLLRSCLRRIWVQHFIRDFGLFSIFLIAGSVLFAFGVGFGAYHWIHNWNLGVGTPLGTIMLSVLPIILGVQLLLQALVLDVQNAPAAPLHRQAEQIRALRRLPGVDAAGGVLEEERREPGRLADIGDALPAGIPEGRREDRP